MLAAQLCGCGPDLSDLPPVPRIDDSGFRQVARDQLDAAYVALDSAPRSAEAAAELGMTLHAYEQLAEAEAAYRRARMLEPRSVHYTYLHGLALDEQGRTDEAAEAFRSVLERQPDSARAAARLAGVLSAASRSVEAAALVEEARGRHPGDPELAFLHGRILASQGSHDEAGAIYDRLLDRGIRATNVLYAAAQSARALGDLERAEALLQEHAAKSGTLEPRWPDPVVAAIRARNRTATGRVQHAADLDAQGAPLTQIAEILEEAVELDKEAYEAHISLTGVYGRIGNFAKVDEHYAAALAFAPDVAQLHFNLGLARMRQARLDDARMTLERAVELDPAHAMARAVLGQVRAEQGLVADGLRLIDEAIGTSPHDPALREIRARVLLQAGRHDEALDALSRVPAAPQRQVARLVMRAEAYRGMGDTAAAVGALRQAAAISERIGASEQAGKLRRAAQHLSSR